MVDAEHPQDGDEMVSLDRITHGVHEKKMIYLAGRPKCGKSMLVASIIPNIAAECPDGKVVRVVTMEMDTKAYLMRMAAIMAQVDSEGLLTGFGSIEEQVKFEEALEYLDSLPIEFIENTSRNTLRRSIDNEDAPTHFWVLDNFGLYAATGKMSSSGVVDSVGAANDLQGICQGVCTGMIIGHMNRASVGKKPTLESLAGSDQIGRNADEIWLLYKLLDGLDVDPEMVKDGEPAEVIIQSRSGRGGAASLWWDKKYGYFKEISGELWSEGAANVPEKKGKK